MVMVNFFDHRPWGKFKGAMVMVSALPPLPQIMIASILIIFIIVDVSQVVNHMKQK